MIAKKTFRSIWLRFGNTLQPMLERPPNGPPCAVGKDCGIELHLPQLIECPCGPQSDARPYLEHNRSDICEKCLATHQHLSVPNGLPVGPGRGGSQAVDQRRGQRGIASS